MSLPGTKSDIMSPDDNDRISELREKLSLQARERWRRNLGILRLWYLVLVLTVERTLFSLFNLYSQFLNYEL